MVYVCFSYDFMHPVSCAAPSGLSKKKKNIGETLYSRLVSAVVAVLQLRPQRLSFVHPFRNHFSVTYIHWLSGHSPTAGLAVD